MTGGRLFRTGHCRTCSPVAGHLDGDILNFGSLYRLYFFRDIHRSRSNDFLLRILYRHNSGRRRPLLRLTGRGEYHHGCNRRSRRERHQRRPKDYNPAP